MQERVRQLLGQHLGKSGLQAAEIRYRMLHGSIDIDGLRLESDRVSFRSERVSLRTSFFTLIAGTLDIRAINIRGLEIDLHADPASLWDRHIFDKAEGFPAWLYPALAGMERLHILDMMVTVAGPKSAHLNISTLQLELTGRVGETLQAGVQASLAGGSIKIETQWEPAAADGMRAHGSMQWEGFAIDQLQPFIPLPLQKHTWRGESEGNLRFSAQSGGKSALQVAGQVKLLHFSLADPDAPTNKFQAEEVRLHINGFDSHSQHLEIAELHLVRAGWEVRVTDDQAASSGKKISSPSLLQQLCLDPRTPDSQIQRITLTQAAVNIVDARTAPVITVPLQLVRAEMVRDNEGKYVVQSQVSLSGSQVNVTGTVSLVPFGLKLDIEARDFAVATLAAFAPRLDSHLLQAGTFSGDARILLQTEHASGQLRELRMQLSGLFRDLQYKTPRFPDWNIGSVEVRKARISARQPVWVIDRMAISDAHINYRPTFAKKGEVVAHPSPHISDLQIRHLDIELLTRTGKRGLGISDLAGTGRVDKQGFKVRLKAHQEREEWHLRISGQVLSSRFNVTADADHVPVVQFRSIMPDFTSMSSGSVPELSGDTSLTLNLEVLPGGIRYSGRITVQNFLMGQAGNLLQADRAELQINRAGLGENPQSYTSLHMRDWLYQAALSPLGSLQSAATTVPPAIGPGHKSWRLDRLVLENGKFSLGNPQDIWLSHINGTVNGLAPGQQAVMDFSARAGGGKINLNGTLNMMQSMPAFKIQAKIRDVVPFFANDWLTLSRMPPLLRGRLSADLQLGTKPDSSVYGGEMKLRLQHGQLQHGTFPDDPLLQLTGHSSQNLLDKLSNRHWNLTLEVPVSGDQHSRSPDWSVLGTALVDELRRQAGKVRQEKTKKNSPPSPKKISSLRLHERGGFSYNERIRLFKIIHFLRRNRQLVLEMEPRLGAEVADAALFRRMRYTQTVIERFLHRRGISLARIFPVWPQASQREGETSSIRLIVHQP